MSDWSPHALLEELAAATVMAEPGDRPSLELLLGLFRSLEEALAGAGGDLRGQAATCRQTVERVLAAGPGGGAAASADLAGLGDGITGMRRRLSEGPGTAAPAAPTSGEFRLPDWVDEALFREFVSVQKSSLAEVEGEILALEKSGVAAVPPLKRRLHSLKGEAGVVGASELEHVYHAAEDFLEAPLRLAEKVERLLRVRDWVEQSLLSYMDHRLPTPPGDEIVRALRDRVVEAKKAIDGPVSPSYPVLDAPPTRSSLAAVGTATGLVPPVESVAVPAVGVGAVQPSPGAAPALPVPAAEPVSAPPPQAPPDLPVGPAKGLGWDDERLGVFAEFWPEANDGLTHADQTLTAAESEGIAPDKVQSILRFFHSTKGVAGFLSLTDMTTVAHAAEAVLELVRDQRLELAGPVLEGVLEANGLLRKLLDQAKLAADRGLPVEPSFDAQEIAEQLGAIAVDPGLYRTAPATAAPPVAGTLPAVPAAPPASLAPPTVPTLPRAAPAAPPSTPPAPPPSTPPAPADPSANPWDEQSLSLLADFLQESGEGLATADQTLMNLEQDGATPEKTNTLFRIFHTVKGVSGFLNLNEITKLAHATESLLDLIREGQIELRGQVLDVILDSTGQLRRMLDLVKACAEGGRAVPSSPEVLPLVAKLQAISERREVKEEPLPVVQPGAKLGDIVSQIANLAPGKADAAIEAQKLSGRRFGEEMVAQGLAEPKQIAQALRVQRQSEGATPAAIKETIKVDVDRVDSLVEMIGELVIVQSMVINRPEIQELKSHEVRNYLGQLTKITRDLQRMGMRMRMMPVRGVFQKMSRLVHDLSRKGNKQVRLVIAGEGTEMDRSMVEQIGDPLVHMIRNSMDHGIESAEDRAKAGKPAVATIKLSAFHEGGSIAIEVSDDGKGLDREAILNKARQRGIVREGQPLTEQETFDLIFAAGFSTAKQVTELSGRGVGMDVVKRNVESMRGRIFTTSPPGRGTTFKIVLPLTLAIIDGMLIACGEEQYIIPTLSIVESIQPDATMIFSSANRGEVINLRGEILTLIRLDRLFDIEGAKKNPTEALVVVIESFGRRLGLVVDSVITQQQVVIKSLGTGLGDLKFISGAAILSDGKVGLILNVEEIGRLLGDRSFRDAAVSDATKSNGKRSAEA